MPPSLARKLLICAAVDGLIVQPLTSRNGHATQQQQQQIPPRPLRIRYRDAIVSSLSALPADAGSGFEAFGVIGLFTVARLSYLITITGRQEVAQIRGYPVYVVTEVALIPCTSHAEAQAAVSHTTTRLQEQRRDGRKLPNPENGAKGNNVAEGADVDDKTASPSSGSEIEGEGNTNDASGSIDEIQSDRDSLDEDATDKKGSQARRSSIAEDVIKRRGGYGRFAQRWFGNRTWVSGGKISEATKEEEAVEEEDKKLSGSVVAETTNAGVSTAVSTGESLLPKLLRMAHIWFGSSRSFYFSYDMDITRSLHNTCTYSNTQAPDTPLHRRADALFFWNRHLLQPIADAGEDAFILPIMQGFVGQRTFAVDRNPPQATGDLDSMELADLPTEGEQCSQLEEDLAADTAAHRKGEKEFSITVISRRSVQRAGLRYLRRGIDDHGFAANGVETEQLLSTPDWNGRVHSVVQARGSIPLFFTQTPYSLKPTPVLQHSEETNLRAFTRHFEQMRQRYGALQIVNLVEKHGVEAVVGDAYASTVVKYNDGCSSHHGDESKCLKFEWFDFHAACRGMKFENVSLLLDTMAPLLDDWGSTMEENGQILRRQKGVLRTNCMDCLDRTNVCQSSFAKYALDMQLREEGFDASAQKDQTTAWFNTLWADNGDAISKQYASTAAMKGDYTRTRKRDYRGMVNDLGLSLSRFYNGMVNDYFSQAAIDFLLGNVTSLVFEEFEANMMTKDPAVSMAQMRELAIETSHKIAVEDDKEDFIGGWTLLSPRGGSDFSTINSSSVNSNKDNKGNTATADLAIRSAPLEEVVLLLTDVALYLCRFDWKLDKVSSFERVALDHIVGIHVGTYITSTISPAEADESKNVGLVVTYEPGKNDIKRINTRSLTSVSTETTGSISGGGGGGGGGGVGGILAPIFGGRGSGSTAKKQQDQKAIKQKRIALKALYAHSSISDARARANASKKLTEKEEIDVLASEIERLVLLSRREMGIKGNEGKREEGKGHGDGEGRDGIIERGDIISLAQAKKNTGLLEQLGHSLMKLVWA